MASDLYFLDIADTQFERPLERRRSLSPRRGNISSRAVNNNSEAFDDFVPLEDMLSVSAVNASLAKTLESGIEAAQLKRNLDNDATFQDVLTNLGAQLHLSPDGAGLFVEANGRGGGGGLGLPGDLLQTWWQALQNIPAKTVPEPPQQPQSVFIPAQPAALPLYVPSIPSTSVNQATLNLDQYGIQVALFYQKAIIQFADSVAGALGHTTVDPVLKNGLEDLIRLSEKLERSNREFIASFRRTGTVQPGSVPVDATGKPLPYVPQYQLAATVKLTDQERDAVNELQLLINELKDGDLALSVYREQRAKQSRESTITLEQLTLPAKMATLYFASNVSAAIEYCLHIVEKNTTGLDPRTLFHTIINSDARQPFARFVASYVRQSQGNQPNSYHTGIQYSRFDTTYYDSIRELSRCTFKVQEDLPFIKMISL